MIKTPPVSPDNLFPPRPFCHLTLQLCGGHVVLNCSGWFAAFSSAFLIIFPSALSLTDHALQLHQQVQEAGVADGHVRLSVPQSHQLHHQIIHHDAWSTHRAIDKLGWGDSCYIFSFQLLKGKEDGVVFWLPLLGDLNTKAWIFTHVQWAELYLLPSERGWPPDTQGAEFCSCQTPRRYPEGRGKHKHYVHSLVIPVTLVPLFLIISPSISWSCPTDSQTRASSAERCLGSLKNMQVKEIIGHRQLLQTTQPADSGHLMGET